MLVRYQTVHDVGKLDEKFFFYSEELDWCYRIKGKKWKIWYITDVEVYHLGGGSASRGSLMQLIRLYQSKLRYFSKYHGILSVTVLRFGLAIANILGVIKRLIFSNWMHQDIARQRIIDQSKLAWCLFWNQYP
jgi:GT2 family glycosyltransferase